MPKNTVSDPITDQERAFAHLVLSGTLANPFINPQQLNRVPAATDCVFDAVLGTAGSPRLPFSPRKGPFARRR